MVLIVNLIRPRVTWERALMRNCLDQVGLCVGVSILHHHSLGGEGRETGEEGREGEREEVRKFNQEGSKQITKHTLISPHSRL